MATQSIDTTIFSSTHPDIAKRTSISKLISSIVLLLIGILIFIAVFKIEDRSSAIGMALMVGGTALILFSIFRFFWKLKETIYLPTGSITKESSLYFDLKHLGKLTEMLKNKQLDEEHNIKSDNSGNLRMDVILSQDKKFVAVQLFQFVPYNYTPVMPVCYFTGDDAAAISTFLSKCKTA